jgi:hypothetical protein
VSFNRVTVDGDTSTNDTCLLFATGAAGAPKISRAGDRRLADFRDKLEQVMLDFYHRRCNVLVCTTIIETGIDIPNANTMLINRADRFGLAQLYQLRGRVGRSHHRAYRNLGRWTQMPMQWKPVPR